MALFSVVTINVRGMRNIVKRASVFQYLLQTPLHVCFLQEVHLKDGGDVREFSEGWLKGESRWGVGGVHSSGVGILFGNKDFQVRDSFSVVQGRVLVVDALWRGVFFRFINVYAPAEPKGRKALFIALMEVCVTNKVVVLGGDFNVSLEGTGDFSRPYLEEVVQAFMLKDGYRAVEPAREGTTWSNTRGSRSRIDFVFVPAVAAVRRAVVGPVWFSDHNQLEVAFSVAAPIFGRGYWKLNCGVLEEEAFRRAFTLHYEGWVSLKPFFDNIVEWWEYVKVNARELTVGYCSQRAREEKGGFRRLQRELQAMMEAENKGERRDKQREREVRENLGLYFKGKADGLLRRCGRESINVAETCSPMFFKQVRAARARACIPGLRGKDGDLVSDPEGMVGVASNFFGDAMGPQEVEEPEEGGFLKGLEARVPREVVEALERPVGLAELEGAMKGLGGGKVPGIDGLPKEFYAAFWGILGKDFLEVVGAVLERGLLGRTMREGVLTLLHKKGEKEDLGNFRPITLLCADYKIIARVLAGRLRSALPHVVNEDQTCGVEGRRIQWNLGLVRDCIHWVEERGVPLMLVGLDMEKAFDRVNQGFLAAVLERMGFGPIFRRWLGIMYTGVGSRVVVNGHMGVLVSQQTGVRQGCPLSPLLFVIYIEPLAAAIRADAGVKGLRLPGGGERDLRISQYADDMTLFLTTEGSLLRALDVLGSFSKVSGARVNVGKSKVKYFGPWKGRGGGLFGLSECEGPMRILGVDFEDSESGPLNWRRRLAALRSRIGLWKARRLSLTGRVLVVKADILPSMIYLAYVFPLPPEYRRRLVRDVFSFVWGGYEYVRRGWMRQGVPEGGRGVPDVPLKLDVLFFSFCCNGVKFPSGHWYHVLLMFWLSFPLRKWVKWENGRPKGEVMPPHYRQMMGWAKRHKECGEGDLGLDHRELYKAIVAKQGPVRVCGVGREEWLFAQHKELPNRLKDINWLCLHKRMPVRDTLYRHGLSRLRSCPRLGCGRDEDLSHVFWGCGFARTMWGELGFFFPKLGGLSYEMLMLGVGLRGRGWEGFLLWLILSIGKAALWDDRMALIRSNEVNRVEGVVAKVRGEVRRMKRREEERHGYHAAKERWKGVLA